MKRSSWKKNYSSAFLIEGQMKIIIKLNNLYKKKIEKNKKTSKTCLKTGKTGFTASDAGFAASNTEFTS